MTDAYAEDPILNEAAEKWFQFRGEGLMPRDASELWHSLSEQVRSQSIMSVVLDNTGNALVYRSGAIADRLFEHDLAGLRLDEFLQPAVLPLVQQLYRDMVGNKRPVYAASDFAAGNQTRALRRLLLPIASDHENIADGALVVFSWDEAADGAALAQDADPGEAMRSSLPVAIPVRIERRGLDQARLERDPACRPQSDISRQALAVWQQAKKGSALPIPRDELIPFRLKDALPNIAIIEHEAASDRFRYRLCGSVSVAIASRDVTGRYLDEIYTKELAARYVPILHDMLRSGNPARLFGTLAPPGKPVRKIEYMCLPVSSNHRVIDQVIVVNAYIGETGEMA
jgi:hypothetical protein